ncbi:MAG TPA: UbiA family prenyltransferase [Humisphaera sp.]
MTLPDDAVPTAAPSAAARLRVPPLVRLLRPHQWVKNVLVLVPVTLAHVLPWRGPEQALQWSRALAALVAFCLTASAVYVVNDLADLQADRAHPTKRRRPFAAGDLPARAAPLIVLGLLAGAALACAVAPPGFALILAGYAALSAAYSFWLKRRLLVDVFVLAGLYAVRLLGGAAAAGVEASNWMLAFAMFLFTSLAFAKRYVELHRAELRGDLAPAGRGYRVEDLRLIEGVGPASGFMAVLVLALYVNDATGKVGQLYRKDATFFLWLLCPLLMYWVTRVWFLARRGAMNEDPIVYALTDRVSWLVLLAAAALVLAAWQPWLR